MTTLGITRVIDDPPEIRELVHAEAQSIADMIAREAPELDVSWDVYAMKIDGYEDSDIVYMIYMGDCGSWLYEPSVDGESVVMITHMNARLDDIYDAWWKEAGF